MVPVVIAGNISAEATTPAGNIFAEAMRGIAELNDIDGVRARFEETGPVAFTCTVLNRLMRGARNGE
jgi:hypothetical protein